MNFLTQLIGFASLVFTIVGFLSNKRRTILLMLIISLTLFSVHLYLLDAITGAAVSFIGAIRTLIFLKDEEFEGGKQWLYLFIFIFLVVGIVTWQSYYSILPIAGMILGTIGFWQKKTKKMRIIVLLASLSWITYNIAVKSYPGVLRELAVATSILTSIVKYDLIKNPALKNKAHFAH